MKALPMDDISDPSGVSHHTQLDFSPCHATEKDLAYSYYGHGKCELAMSVKPISQGGWRGACWWCWGAVLQSRVLAVLPRIMAVASSLCHLQNHEWLWVHLRLTVTLSSMNQSPGRGYGTGTSLPRWNEEVPAATLHFPYSAFLPHRW